jgi:hypothetical protein
MRVSGWSAFLLWGLVGGLYALACLAMMSIGIYILLIAIVTTIVATRTLKVWPEILGLAVGAPAAILWIAVRAWDLPRCGPGERDGVAISAVSGSWSVETGAYSETYSETGRIGCTELEVRFLVWTASALAAATLVAYIRARNRARMLD